MDFECFGNLQDLCRLCLKSFTHCPQSTRSNSYVKTGGMFHYSHSLLIPRLSKLFLDLTTLNVNEEIDGFPKSLCTSCRKKLMEYDELRKEALKSTKRLQEMWSNRAEKDHIVVDMTKIKRYVKTSTYTKKDFIKSECLEADKSQDVNDDQLLLPELANMPINIKVEPDYEFLEAQELIPWHNIDFPMSDHQVQNTVLTSTKSLEVTYKCSICSHEYLTKRELKEHASHHVVPCSQCSKVFSSKSTLNRHIKVVHRGEKRFSCSFCTHRFATFISVIHHERQHTGERPYTCEICNKGFVQKKSLRVHMKRHEKKLID